ncbi:phospholipase D-like domain-containing protein [Haladaptatus sp. ZSTT2]|uniref:phospholipase D-like domain-containing protein n=1 Tax=Haladaptatus sp. ZSTT2 TaxID=3120515 RepID=UPI00300ED8FB
MAAFHEWLLEELGLVSGNTLTLLGTLVLTSAHPEPLIRATAVTRLDNAEVVLRSCSDIEESLRRREFDSLLADEWDTLVLTPVLSALGFVTIYSDSVESNLERIESALTAQREKSSMQAVRDAYGHVLPHLLNVEDERCLLDVAKRVVGETPSTDFPVEAVAAGLASESETVIDSEGLEKAIVEQREHYSTHYDELRSLLVGSDTQTLTRAEVDTSIEKTAVLDDDDLNEAASELLVNVLATVDKYPEHSRFDLVFITRRLSATEYEIHQALNSIPGVECTVSPNGLVEFTSLPDSIVGEDLRDEYMAHLIDRCSTVKQRLDALTDVTIEVEPPAGVAERMVAQEFAKLRDGDVAPTYFTYTLINPEALGEKRMNAYVGDSRGLGQERAHLRRWHEHRPSGLRSYTSMTDRLFSLGLERDFENKVLRIMTPFDDDTFNEYVAQIRRLLEHGFEVRLLTRHTKQPWEWERLQENLFSEIKDHRDRLTVRTYSRFKEHQRVTPDMEFRNLGEFGIHGKVYTIGHADEGAALLGSANFMENSYNWNPECGVYTERTQFVEAAIEFFDIVWTLSEADELDIERLQEIPNRQLVPTHYS